MALHFTERACRLPAGSYAKARPWGELAQGPSAAPSVCLSARGKHGELSRQGSRTGETSGLCKLPGFKSLIQWFSVASQSTAPELSLMAQQTLDSLSKTLASAGALFQALESRILLPSWAGHRLKVTIAPRKPNPDPASLDAMKEN